MPFKSRAQRRKFYYLRSVGKLDQKTIDEWEKATPENIPERVMTKKSFMLGFYKRAAETFMAPASPDTGEHGRALLWNEAGGVDPRTPEDMDAAAAVGLMTLPPDVEGASCANCVYFRPLDPDLGAGFCTNPQVKQDVTDRMLCSVWENAGAHRPYEDVGTELPAGRPATNVLEEDPTGLAGQIMGDMQTPADPAMEEGVEDPEAFDRGQAPAGEQQTGASPAGEQQAMGADSDNTGTPRQETESAPKPEKKEKSSDKKSSKANGHTINVNIGGEKKASALVATMSEKQAANIHMILKRLGKLKKGTSVDAYLKRRRR